MSDDNRLDRIEVALGLLAAEVMELTQSVRITEEVARRGWEAHLESRADIARLYAEWPEHLRESRADIARLYEDWGDVRAEAQRQWEESRADIARLYAAWPEHLRNPRPNGHGE